MNKFALVLLVMFLFSASAQAATYSTYPARGTIKNAYVIYASDTSVTVKTGYGECNGKYWEITSDITHTMSTLDTSDFYYIYIDDSAASYPALDSSSIIHSNTEPAWSDAKQGYYNGDDRCIGVVWTEAANTIMKFGTSCNGDEVTQVLEDKNCMPVAGNVTSGDSWRDVTTWSDYVPVNGVASLVCTYQSDTGTPAASGMKISSYELKAVLPEYHIAFYDNFGTQVWITLGDSRDISWLIVHSTYGDQYLSLRQTGYKYKR